MGSQPTAEEMEGKDIIDGEVMRSERRPSASAAITRQAPTQPEDTEQRRELYASLQDIATAGLEAYAEAWAKLSKEQRAMIGQRAHEMLKATAEEATISEMDPHDHEEVPL
ncbi:hypothetical protein [Xanthomonas sp. BRIP62409]|uniref:hypothetical protein n=1 Tax=Xanthomonas sp. BRIP62409 TaxID=2182388 RepID=UPI000F8D5BD1|nr:hypothetical protein [Xanthomonas sp. BRIP62409]